MSDNYFNNLDFRVSGIKRISENLPIQFCMEMSELAISKNLWSLFFFWESAKTRLNSEKNSTILFSSLNCQFWVKITKMITRVIPGFLRIQMIFQIVNENSHHPIGNYQKIAKIIYRVQSLKSRNPPWLSFLWFSLKKSNIASLKKKVFKFLGIQPSYNSKKNNQKWHSL